MAVTPTQHNLTIQISLVDNITLEPLSNKDISISYQTYPENVLGAQPTLHNITRTTDANGEIETTVTYTNAYLDSSYGVEAYYAGDNEYKSATSKLTSNS